MEGEYLCWLMAIDMTAFGQTTRNLAMAAASFSRATCTRVNLKTDNLKATVYTRSPTETGMRANTKMVKGMDKELTFMLLVNNLMEISKMVNSMEKGFIRTRMAKRRMCILKTELRLMRVNFHDK